MDSTTLIGFGVVVKTEHRCISPQGVGRGPHVSVRLHVMAHRIEKGQRIVRAPER
jgi:hypothetical protein